MDVPGATVAAAAHKNRGVFSFLILIWSLYTATSGQATPSASGPFSLAATAEPDVQVLLGTLIVAFFVAVSDNAPK